MIDERELLELATDLACRAADLLHAAVDDERTMVGTKSTGTDMVTEMDAASERLLVEGILAARPDDAVLGEEGGERAGGSGVRWIVDPLDGTTNYLYRLPPFAVSIGVEVHGEPAVGVVVDVLRAEVFSARRGAGAFKDGQRLGLGPPPPLAEALVATGFGYDAEQRHRQAALLTHVLPRVRDIRRAGAASVDLCSVAAGRVDAYYEAGLAPWDRAAGALIAREAGAEVTDLRGGPPTSELTVAAAPPLAATLRQLLASAGATS